MALISHPKWLEVPKAYIVLKEGSQLTAEKIVLHCAEKMAKFKVPKEIEFIDSLPRNPSGKVLKRHLREMHARKGGSN
ncbi:MAG: AMP-binding enzyme [Dissulfuribacterales bacterium]